MDKIKSHILKNTDPYSKLFLVVGFLCAIASSLSTPDRLWNDCYYHLFEMAFFFYLLAFYLKSIRKTKEYNTLWKTITLIILLCSFSTLVDEVFYDAKVIEWNDLVRISLVIFASIELNYKKITLWKI